jgi:uncharacterized membrane protein
MHRSHLVRSALLLPACLCLVAAAPAESFDWRAFLAPFHTVTLHLPIGFVTLGIILEAYILFRPSEALRRALGLVMWVSGISAVVVTLLGLFRASGGGYEEEMLKHHEFFGIAVAGATVVLALLHNIAYRGGEVRSGFMVGLYRLLLLGDMVLLTIAGHGGGNLTHGSKYLVEGAPEWAKQWLEEKSGASGESKGTEAAASKGDSVFATVIRPAFEKKCYSCHGAEKQKGDFRMDTVEDLFKAGESELDPIVANKPLESYLVELITLPGDDDAAMPPDGKDRLTAEETIAILQWIWDGAKTE